MKDGLSQMIVNLEAQKDEPTGYHILNRAVFYVSRLISSQKERDFVNTNYNDIKRVFSIWVCMNMDKNSLAYVHLAKEDLVDAYPWEGGLDLLNIVLIGIANELPEHDDKYELHRLLTTLLSTGMAVDEKINIINTEYEISVDDKLRKDVSAMCNLSQGIIDNTLAQVVMNMHRDGYSSEQIARAVGKTVEEVQAIIKKKLVTA